MVAKCDGVPSRLEQQLRRAFQLREASFCQLSFSPDIRGRSLEWLKWTCLLPSGFGRRQGKDGESQSAGRLVRAGHRRTPSGEEGVTPSGSEMGPSGSEMGTPSVTLEGSPPAVEAVAPSGDKGAGRASSCHVTERVGLKSEESRLEERPRGCLSLSNGMGNGIGRSSPSGSSAGSGETMGTSSWWHLVFESSREFQTSSSKLPSVKTVENLASKTQWC